MSGPRTVRFLDRTTPPHILTLVMLASMGAMNMAIFLPSLPSMTTYFNTRYEVMQLAVSLYLFATGVLQLFIGPLADRFGRRRVTMWGLAVFILATLGCLVAPTIEVFLAARMMQSTVAVGIVLSRAMVRDMYPTNEAASMIGYVTMGMALVPMIAPMIGGILEQLFFWQASFVVLALAGFGVLVLVFFDQGETNPGGGMSFAEQRREMPELFRSLRFWGYVLAAAFASGGFFAFLGGAPLVASEIYGLSAFWSGLGFGAPAVGYAVGNFLSGRFSARVGVNPMVLTGTLITAAGMTLAVSLSLLGLSSALVFFGCCTSIGLGNGLVIPNAAAGSLSVRPHLAGTASGIGSAAMIGGGSLLSVLAGVVMRLDAGSLPLTLLMLASSLCGVASILYVIRRERQVTG